MVKIDWVVIGADTGEPVEKVWSSSAGPLASVPEGPETVHD